MFIEGQAHALNLTNSLPALTDPEKHGHRRSMLSQHQSAPSNVESRRGLSRTHIVLCKRYGVSSGR